MKIYKKLIFTIFVCLLTAASINAQQTTTEKKIYRNIVIEKFTFHENSDFPADKIDDLTKSVMATLTRSSRFDTVTIAEKSETPDSVNIPTLKITGNVLKYVKGSRTSRYVIGGGVGATRIITDIKFIDVKTGDVVYEGTLSGDVTEGVFGGDSDDAKGGVASEIINVMKRNGLAGDKIKKNK